ncbi:MAG: SpoIID/LytB domain-containing protein [Planctomycetes bacterium]|nr:SpoIID/LytB domain-containing protein [Planctomycetota bacterium]
MRHARRRTRTSRGVVLVVLLAVAGLTALIVSPPGRSTVPDGAPLDLFQAEPDIRALLRSVRAGGNILLGEDGAKILTDGAEIAMPEDTTLTWNGQQLVWGDRAIRLPCTLGPASGDTINLDDGQWPGEIHFETDGATLLVIAHTPLEEYLVGVVQAEMGASFAAAALEAQSIACRSYAATQIANRRSARYDVDTTQLTQVWRGAGRPSRKVRRAVEATRSFVLSHANKLVEGVFSATCGGATRSAGEAFGGRTTPPLAGVECGHCSAAPFATWSADRNASEVAAALGLPGTVNMIGALEFATSGRLASAVVHCDSGPVSLSASKIKRALGPEARSTWITRLRAEGANVHAEGRGFGHGVGLCQHGAGSMASRSGWNCAAILAHYYPGAKLARLYLP